MRGFEPSPFSGPLVSGDYGVDLSWLGPAIQAGGAIASTSIQTVGARKALESQQQADLELAEAQQALIALQTEGERAKIQSSKAASLIEGAKSEQTLILVGGLVLLVGMVTAGLILYSRSAKEDEE